MATRHHHTENHDPGAAPGSCSGHAPKADHLTVTNSADVTECLVMPGTPVIKSEAEEAGLYRDYNGQRYWLCCATCGPLFDADPDRYADAA
ncbi:hypothetical protein [Nesterenkonia haasae]|uniref:hypothetical protein n=1 Tax=Nesterenkonia haasae TaxID=2587813 RepID=UPI001390D111|nr:hypothetical protein [Nesterenkonia haasae]NDK33018.1 YHS domain-containing protein [Nesterenkonia haasae]